MPDITPIASKVRQIVRMFSSDRESEVVAASRALMRLLKSNGCDIHTLADAIGTGTINGKQYSAAEAAEFYRRGVADGRREAEAQLAQRTSTVHRVEDYWGSMVAACIDRIDRFTAKEQQFLQDMQYWDGEPTEKQLRWLGSLYTRVQR